MTLEQLEAMNKEYLDAKEAYRGNRSEANADRLKKALEAIHGDYDFEIDLE